jgi:CubicO group peptidase (beta-lactamase class C family)
MVMSRRAALGCGLAVISITGRRAWSGATPPSGPLSTSEVERLLRQHNVPGAGLAILAAGEIVAAHGYGLARDTLFVSKATRFQAASISKTVNALLVLTLVRDGVVNLDDPVNKHLKSFTLSGPDADQVTVRMLSSHSGGTSVEGFAGYIPGQPLPSLRQILAGGGTGQQRRGQGRSGPWQLRLLRWRDHGAPADPVPLRAPPQGGDEVGHTVCIR